MGKGLYVTIVNNSSDDITTGMSGVNCLYNGDKLEGLEIARGEESLKYYLEGDGSDSCAFQETTFTISFTSDDHTIGTAGFTENGHEWSKNDASPNIQSVLTPGNQYQLVITITNQKTNSEE